MPPETAGIVGILLAAGRSSRFGGDKLLHPLPDGTPIAVASARALRAACTQCLTVLRPDQDELASLLAKEGIAVHRSSDAEQGMGRSLALAIGHAAEADGWLVALADMPFIRPASCAEVLAKLSQGARLVAPFHKGRRGHPVGFAREWRAALVGLEGDAGARALLADEAGAMTRIDTDDAGVLRDIDSRADLG